MEVTPRTEIETTLRWIHYGERAQLDLETQGGNLASFRRRGAAAVIGATSGCRTPSVPRCRRAFA